jgi:hypothetical protein
MQAKQSIGDTVVRAVDAADGRVVSIVDYREGPEPKDLVIHIDYLEGVYYITYYDEEEITGIELEAKSRAEAIAAMFRVITGQEIQADAIEGLV